MGPNVKILMGQSFGSWTHGHGPMALGAWAAAARPPGRRRRGSVWYRGGEGRRRRGHWASPWAQTMGPSLLMCPGAKALAHKYFDIWAHKYLICGLVKYFDLWAR